ncbi:MAG TPA: rhodanese-like domain-containing protein [Thermoanaerobaculia bacterium]|jgi:3-mercaptopyruvate sulfurtransferase SseA|nr:rhodanese-like domain-containing protein [Thermoanaerobaculia bacterium]
MLKHLFPLAVLIAVSPPILAIGGTQAQSTAPKTPAAQAAPADPAAEAPRISVADAKKAIDAGKAVLVDVRSAMSYEMEHAKGAISLPTHEVAARMGELPKNKQIITYCT